MKLDNNIYKLTVSATLMLATAVTGCGKRDSNNAGPLSTPTAEAVASQNPSDKQTNGSGSTDASITATPSGEIESSLDGLKTARNVGASIAGVSAAVAIAAKLERSYHGLEKLFSSVEKGSLQFSDSMTNARTAVVGLRSEVMRHKGEIDSLLGSDYVKARGEYFSAQDNLAKATKSPALLSAESAVTQAEAQVVAKQSALRNFLANNKVSGPGTRANEVALLAKPYEDAITNAQTNVQKMRDALSAAVSAEPTVNPGARLTRELSESNLRNSEETMSRIRNSLTAKNRYALGLSEQKLVAAERALSQKTAFLNKTSMMFAQEFGVLTASKFIGRGAGRVSALIAKPGVMNKIQTVGIVGGVLSLVFTTGMIIEIVSDDAGNTQADLVEKLNNDQKSVIESISVPTDDVYTGPAGGRQLL
jgi:predicted small lipoprotein YifL